MFRNKLNCYNKLMDFDSFKNFIVKDNSLYLYYRNKTSIFAISLFEIEEIVFIFNFILFKYKQIIN